MDNDFGINFSNIPIVNLRIEFNNAYAFVFGEQAERALRPPIQAVEAPMLTWFGMPEDLFTLMLQRAILGIEAYLPAALKDVSAKLGHVSSERWAQIDDPFGLGGRSAVNNIYHRMPSLVRPELSLKHTAPALYERTLLFYKHVRNPLFHGEQLSDAKIDGIRNAFDHVARLYEWIDGWHDPEWIMKGFGFVAGVRSRIAKPID